MVTRDPPKEKGLFVSILCYRLSGLIKDRETGLRDTRRLDLGNVGGVGRWRKVGSEIAV